MESGSSLQGIRELIVEAGGRIASHLPEMLAALLVVVAGFFVGRLARRGARRLIDLANRGLERVVGRGVAASVSVSAAAITVVGEATFWLVFLVALLIAAEIAGFASVTMWLGDVVRHIPSLIVGVAIIVVGYFISIFVRESLRSFTQGTGRSDSLARTAQLFVLYIAVTVGLDQVGIEVAILTLLATVVAAAVAGGFMAAFAYGARRHVSNILGARNSRHALHPGLHVRIGDQEGELLEITRTQISLDTAEGKLLLPAALFDELPVLILSGAADEGVTDG